MMSGGSVVLGLFTTLVFVVLGLLCMVFWIWILIECATKESETGNTKIVWVIIVVLTGIIGAAIYYFVRRPQRIAELGR